MIKKSAPSSTLFDSIVSALLSSYDDSQITTTQGKADCSNVVRFLGALAAKGYLKGASKRSKDFYTEISSQFMASASAASNPPKKATSTKKISSFDETMADAAHGHSVAGTGASGGVWEGVSRGGVSNGGAASGQHIPLHAQGVSWPFTNAPSNAPTAEGGAAAAALAKNTNAAVKGVTGGTLKTMVEGQAPVVVTSDNVQATMVNALVSTQTNYVLAPPQTDAQEAYGSPMPKISFVGNALELCNFPGGYSQLSNTNFGSNPHPGSSDIKSPLLGLGTVATTKVATTGKRRLQAPPASRAEATANFADAMAALAGKAANVTAKKAVPLYYITLQYATRQNFNFTAIKLHQRGHNLTLPACRLYKRGAYVQCTNCNISTFTDTNVTYGCYDMSNVCPSSGAASTAAATTSLPTAKPTAAHRVLVAGDGEEMVEEEEWVYDVDVDEDDGWDIPHYLSPYASPAAQHYHALGLLKESDGEHIGYAGIEGIELRAPRVSNRRRLEGESDDDGGGEEGGPAKGDDGGFASKSNPGGAQIGMLLEAIAAQLTSVLSSNPFANFDLSKATPILAFVACLVGCILLGVAFFLKWDKLERHQQVYLREYRVKAHREHIERDLLAGGTGLPEELNNVFRVLNQVANQTKAEKRSIDLTKPAEETRHAHHTHKPGSPRGRSPRNSRGSPRRVAAHETAARTADDDAREAQAAATGGVTYLQDETEVEEVGRWKDHILNVGPMTLPVLVAEFSNKMISEDIPMANERFNHDELARTRNKPEKHTFFETFYTLSFKHYLTVAWVGSPSLRRTRTIRWLQMVMVVTCAIFGDTLIFGASGLMSCFLIFITHACLVLCFHQVCSSRPTARATAS